MFLLITTIVCAEKLIYLLYPILEGNPRCHEESVSKI
jgi:hypothetical protein